MNIPNLLTVARFCLVPVVVYMIGQGQWTLAFAIFVIAGLTDAVDGFIARKFDQRTVLGAYLDPLADKALLVSIYVTLAVGGVIPSWLAILVVSRDVMILGAVMVSWLLANPVEINPLYVSKANTFAQIAFAAVALGSNAFNIELGRGLMALALVTGALTVVSTGAYLGLWFRHMAANDA
jgi:cardiolipin synthase